MLQRAPFTLVVLAAAFLSASGAHARELPADACSLLSAGKLGTILAQAYSASEKSVAPAGTPNGVKGTQCAYHSQSGPPRKVVFIVYVDSSSAEATNNLDRLSAMFRPQKQLTGVADAAYLDSSYAVHARQGKVRFYVNIIPIGTYSAEKEKQLKDLATWVSGQL